MTENIDAANSSVPSGNDTSKGLPSQAYLLECFDYNPETGVVTWKKRPESHFAPNYMARFNTKHLGKEAGNKLRRDGEPQEIQCGLNGRMFRLHRIIWVLLHGSIPVGMKVDHRDGNPWNNKLSNLRLATQAQNLWNSKKKSGKADLPKGVNAYRGKFEARIRIHGKVTHLGYFFCPIEAGKAYDKASQELHGEFAVSAREVPAAPCCGDEAS